jgi:nitroreductase
MTTDLACTPLPAITVDLLLGIVTTRAIRRYKDEDIPEEDLRAMLFAASRGSSGSNRQPTRFLVLRRTEAAGEARRLLGLAARTVWERKSVNEGYGTGSGAVPSSRKWRMAQTMQMFAENIDRSPVIVFACLAGVQAPDLHHGASVYPAVQNLLLAARSLGYGGVLTTFHREVQDDLVRALNLPQDVTICATVPIGRPMGNHGPVRRMPLSATVHENVWGAHPSWAVEPPPVRAAGARSAEFTGE